MIAIEEVQTVGMFMNAFFAIAVATVPIRDNLAMKAEIHIYNKARWMLVAALVLLSSHYVMQRTFGFRHMDGYQAAIVNILFYVPAVVFFNLSILELLYFGKLKRWHKVLGYGIVITVYVLLLGAGLIADGGLMGNSPLVQAAEYVSGGLSSLMLVMYNFDEIKQLNRLDRYSADYYDSPQLIYMRWYRNSAGEFAILALITPVAMYFNNPVLHFVIGALAFTAISVLILCFLLSGVEGVARTYKAYKADEESRMSADEIATGNPVESSPVVLALVSKWLTTGRQFKAGITADEISGEMGVSRQELKRYIQSQGYPKIGSWLAVLRIEEAKRLLLSCPDYSHDAIAEQSGFSSREYFQTCFRNIVGMPPMQWQKENM